MWIACVSLKSRLEGDEEQKKKGTRVSSFVGRYLPRHVGVHHIEREAERLEERLPLEARKPGIFKTRSLIKVPVSRRFVTTLRHSGGD